MLGALDYARGQLHFEVCDHAIRREDVIRFIDGLAKASSPETWTLLVLDNASIHRHIDPAMTDRWLIQHRFLLVYLPTYSPELNLIEILWKHAKYHWRDFTSWTKETLVQEVTNLLAGFGKTFHIRYA